MKLGENEISGNSNTFYKYSLMKCCVIKYKVFEQSPDASTVPFLNLIFLNYFILVGKHAWHSTHPELDLWLDSAPSHI